MLSIKETALNDKVEVPFGRHFLLYWLQLIFSAPGVMIASIPLWFLLSKLEISMEHQPEQFAGYEALVCLFVGVLAGWGLARCAPVLAVTGKWIWILPVAFILFSSRGGLFRLSVPDLMELLFVGPGEAIGPFLVTFPVCSIVGYSLGMSVAVKVRHVRAASAIPIGFIVICVLALATHALEMRILERWSKMLTVNTTSGVQLAPTANSLCESAYSGWTSRTAPFGTHVEILGRAACDGNRAVADQLPTSTPGQSDRYRLVHVRVLDGPIAGKEGWTMQAGLEQSRSLHY